MRIGLVCPYSLDVAGGVQSHILDLAEYLLSEGHEINILAPAEVSANLPSYVTCAGRSIAVPYNGSISRLTFGLRTFKLVNKWIADGNFDVLHIHEPLAPSVSLLALWAAKGPIVATFHTSNQRSLAMRVALPMVRASLEKIDARIAVSGSAKQTIVEHLSKDAVLIPNGIWVKNYQSVVSSSRFVKEDGFFTIGFIGRVDEKRKGFSVLLDAWKLVLDVYPNTKFFVAGKSEKIVDLLAQLPANFRDKVEYFGEVSSEEKVAFLKSLDLFVAPNIGGESFGIILLEAMAAQSTILASDLDAFSELLGKGEYGCLFENNSFSSCAEKIVDLLGNVSKRSALEEAAKKIVVNYDWSKVGSDIVSVYETVAVSDLSYQVSVDLDALSWVTKFNSRYGYLSFKHKNTTKEK